MKNIVELSEKLKKLNNYYHVSAMLHEISLMSIPEKQALKVYELAKELEKLNY